MAVDLVQLKEEIITQVHAQNTTTQHLMEYLADMDKFKIEIEQPTQTDKKLYIYDSTFKVEYDKLITKMIDKKEIIRNPDATLSLPEGDVVDGN